MFFLNDRNKNLLGLNLIKFINMRINENNDEFPCLTCENTAQCELDCWHRYCGDCTISHLHTSETSLCQECSKPITTIKI
jgi:hypothetical protein